MRRRVAAGVIAFLTASSAKASGPGYVLPWTLDSAGGSRADREALYGGGAPGVLLTSATPAQLFIVWRRLHGCRSAWRWAKASPSLAAATRT